MDELYFSSNLKLRALKYGLDKNFDYLFVSMRVTCFNCGFKLLNLATLIYFLVTFRTSNSILSISICKDRILALNYWIWWFFKKKIFWEKKDILICGEDIIVLFGLTTWWFKIRHPKYKPKFDPQSWFWS